MHNTLRTEILFEIVLNQYSEDSTESILSNALPLYQKKLNCFVVAVYHQSEFTRVLPAVFRNNEKWFRIRESLLQNRSQDESDLIEAFDKGSYYYSYSLPGYGRMILGRKKPFIKTFRNELSKVIKQLGLNLNRAQEKEINQAISQQLSSSRAHLKAVLENTLHSIWSIDRNYCITYINDVFYHAFYQVFGTHLTLGTNILESLPESIRNTWQERYKRVFNGEPITLVDKVESPDSVVHFEVSGTPIAQGDEIVGASFFGSDITKRTETEHRNLTLLERFEQIGSTVPGIIFQFLLKPDGSACFPYVSNNVQRFLGFNSVELSKDAMPVFKLIHKDDIRSVHDTINESARTGNTWQSEFRVLLANKKIIWMQGTARCFKKADGSLVWNGYLHDISNRKQTEMDLVKFSRAIEQNPASVVITDVNGFIEYVNPIFCEVTGYSIDEIFGKKPSVLKSGFQNDDIYKNLWKTITNGETWRGELYNKKKNGDLFWEMVSISPISNTEGEITNYLAIKEDISELKKAEELILKNLKEKNVLLSEIHHRVKNNMAIIYSLLGLQTEFSNMNEETYLVIRDLQSRIKSMGIVHELVYKNDNIATISTTELIKSVSDNLQSIYKQNDLLITVTIQADKIEDIKMDLNKSIPFSLLVNEILTNTWKHAFQERSTGEIGIKLEKNEANLKVSIQDNGKGVSDLDKLENPESYGYTIIHGLVSQLYGSIAFSNVSVGGLKVELEIPLP